MYPRAAVIQIPTSEPSVFIAGDTVRWTRTFRDFSSSDGWVLLYTFLPTIGLAPTGQETEFQVEATSNPGGGWDAAITAADSAKYEGGVYKWQAKVTKAGEVYTVDTGITEVREALGTSGTAPQTHYEKCLAAVTACLEGHVGDPIAEYKIGDREARRYPWKDLIAMQGYYQSKVAQANGRLLITPIPMCFSRVGYGKF